MRFILAIATSLAIGPLAGCAPDPNLGNAVAQTASNATAAQKAQTQFMQSVRDAECRYDKLDTLASYVGGQGTAPNLLAPCVAPDMTDAVFKVRTDLMAAIANYVQAMAALQGVSTARLDTDFQTTAERFSTAATTGGFLAPFANQLNAGAAVTTAVGQISDWVIDQYRKQDVVSMAKANQAPLNRIIEILKQENTLVVQGTTESGLDTATRMRQTMLNPAATQRFVSVLSLQQVFWTGGAPGAGSPSMQVQYPSADDANDALDQLRACHDLVAAGGTLKGSPCDLSPKS